MGYFCCVTPLFKSLLKHFILMSVMFEGLHVDMYVTCNYMMYTTEVIERKQITTYYSSYS